jgi:hypothetical protein
MKKCPTCKIEKSLDQFNKNKTRKDGLSRECKFCVNEYGKKHYHIKNSPRLKENLKEGHKKCSNCNQQLPFNQFNKIKKGRFGISGECKICLQKRYKNWKENGGKEWENNYNKNKRQNNPQWKLKQILRGRLLDALKRHTSGGKVNKTHSAINLLGCSIEEFRLYLEKQFLPEMTWENHGNIWEIDHIKPCSSFDLTNIEQQKLCFHYTNQQPLFKTTKIAEFYGYLDHIGNRDKKDF